jgi:heptosyltransferase-2
MRLPSQRVLFIQTAFIGDAVLLSSAIRAWKEHRSQDICDVCVRAGNESLFAHHPDVNRVHIWAKSGRGRNRRLITLARQLHSERYDVVINVHRHLSSGILTWASRARVRVGYNTHPWRWAFTLRVPHAIGDGRHEVQRMLDLLRAADASFTTKMPPLPALTPGPDDEAKATHFMAGTPHATGPFVALAPASQWFTKQWPAANWRELTSRLTAAGIPVLLLGGPKDAALLAACAADSPPALVLQAATLPLMASYALLAEAAVAVSNDSAPLHFASGANVPTVAVFCSTVPAFGFGPLAADQIILQTETPLACRPCGLHGHKACPQGHFRCADISVDRAYAAISSLLKSC